MSANYVKLMPPAQQKLRNISAEQVRREIAAIFPEAEAISISDILQGFHSDQHHKLILAVETTMPAHDSSPATFESHIVKLGDRAAVAADVTGWQQCTEGRFVSRRMFVPVELVEFANALGRAAVIYRDSPMEDAATVASSSRCRLVVVWWDFSCQ